jgi:hypothetical protein
MQILVRRSKLFIDDVKTAVVSGVDAAGNQILASSKRRFLAPKSDNPIQAPDWIRETLTFKVGIGDQSILDLTPVVVVAAAPAPAAPPKPPTPPAAPKPAANGKSGLQEPK